METSLSRSAGGLAVERAAGGCAGQVGPAAGCGVARRPALQHRTEVVPVKAGPSPPPRPLPRTGPLGLSPLQSRCPSGIQDEGPGSVLSQRTLPASRTGATGWLGLAGRPASQPHHGVPTPPPNAPGGPPTFPRSRRLSYSPKAPSSLPAFLLLAPVRRVLLCKRLPFLPHPHLPSSLIKISGWPPPLPGVPSAPPSPAQAPITLNDPGLSAWLTLLPLRSGVAGLAGSCEGVPDGLAEP